MPNIANPVIEAIISRSDPPKVEPKPVNPPPDAPKPCTHGLDSLALDPVLPKLPSSEGKSKTRKNAHGHPRR